MIKKRGSKWVLYSLDGSEALGIHATKAEAEEHESRMAGDKPGHPFYGNQHTDGEGGGGDTKDVQEGKYHKGEEDDRPWFKGNGPRSQFHMRQWKRSRMASMPDVVRSMSASADGQVRTEKIGDTDYLVFPVVALVEGVLHASNADTPELVTASEIAKSVSSWNGRPLMFNHPETGGVKISANSPNVLAESQIGRVFNARLDGTKLKMDAYVDPTRIAMIKGAEDVVDAIRDGKTAEVSVGVMVNAAERNGHYNGKAYHAEWQGITPDHLALLPLGTPGACSVSMGCGMPRAAAEAREAGDKPGHEFYGNQFSGGGGSSDKGKDSLRHDVDSIKNGDQIQWNSSAMNLIGGVAKSGRVIGRVNGPHGKGIKVDTGQRKPVLIPDYVLQVHGFRKAAGFNPDQKRAPKGYWRPAEGTRVSITEGEHAGMSGIVVADHHQDQGQHVVRLDNGASVKVPCGMLRGAEESDMSVRTAGNVSFRMAADLGPSMNDLREDLREVLTRSVPRLIDVMDVFPMAGVVIYAAQDPMGTGELHYYQQSYELDDATEEVTLADDAQRVEPETSYEPVAAASTCSGGAGSDDEDNNPSAEEDKKMKTKKERAAAIVASGKTCFRDAAGQAMLEAASDEMLAHIEAGIAAMPQSEPEPEPEPVKAAASAPQPQSEEEFLAIAPESIKKMVAAHKANEANTRETLITKLKACQKTYTDEDFKAMDNTQLNKLLALASASAAPANFAGAGVPRAAEGTETSAPPAPDLQARILQARGQQKAH